MEGLGPPLIPITFFRVSYRNPASNPMRIFMHLRSNYVLTAAMLAASSVFLFAPISRAAAAPSDDEKAKVLERLNQSAANFHSTIADVEFEQIETDPVPDTDVQKGVVYYERKNGSFRAGVHFSQHNGKPSAKAYTYNNEVFSLYESGPNQVTTYSKAGKFESYLILGFGASGHDLEAKWNITYLGSENLSDGNSQVKTEKLELIAKDPDVRKNVPKVTIWVDPDRAVSLKQVFTLSSTSTYIGHYSNFKMNQTLPSDAFKFKTDSRTTYQTQ
jgi:outer membrane lipoprotein-sorting protein